MRDIYTEHAALLLMNCAEHFSVDLEKEEASKAFHTSPLGIVALLIFRYVGDHLNHLKSLFCAAHPRR